MNKVQSISLLLCCILPVFVKGRCQDLVSEDNTLEVKDNDGNFLETVTSCSRIVECYPSLCPELGVKNGVCCQACKQLKPFDCMDTLTECTPGTFTRGKSRPKKFNKTETVLVTSCERAAMEFLQCSKDVFGGQGNACCKSCKGVTIPKCTDSETWRSNKKNRSCSELAMSAKQLLKFCRRDAAGMDGGETVSIQRGCCVSCSSIGYPPYGSL